jgi:hypothetical protein
MNLQLYNLKGMLLDVGIKGLKEIDYTVILLNIYFSLSDRLCSSAQLRAICFSVMDFLVQLLFFYFFF